MVLSKKSLIEEAIIAIYIQDKIKCYNQFAQRVLLSK